MQKKSKSPGSTPSFHNHADKERLEGYSQLAKNSKSGFTLLEILLVIGIIAVLAVVIFIALDPAKRFKDARDSRRVTDVENILNAVHQYVVDNKGAFPAGLTEDTELMLGTYGASCDYYNGGCNVDTGACLDLREDLARYLKTIPQDPQLGSEQETYYSIFRSNQGIVTVRACATEGSEITAAR
jgi:prepilin-type N-terminal cleavage/methylation domain-containing protein